MGSEPKRAAHVSAQVPDKPLYISPENPTRNLVIAYGNMAYSISTGNGQGCSQWGGHPMGWGGLDNSIARCCTVSSLSPNLLKRGGTAHALGLNLTASQIRLNALFWPTEV